MRTYKIELSEDQMRLVSNCLQDIHGFANGDCELKNTIEELLRGLPFEEQMERKEKVDELLFEIKKVLFPDLAKYRGLTYDATPFLGNVYQIYRTILFRLAIDNNWDNVYSSPALESGNMGTINVELIKTEEK